MQLTTLLVLGLAASSCAQVTPNFFAKFLSNAVAETTDSNIVVSPYSTLAPLGALVLATEYSTRGEILHALGVTNKSEIVDAFGEYEKTLSHLTKAKLKSDSFVATHNKVNHRFSKDVKTYFDVDIKTLPESVQSSDEIRKWVSKKTGYELSWRYVVPHEEAEAILLNAVILKANWHVPFTSGVAEFHQESGDVYDTRVIRSTRHSEHTYSEELHAEVVSTPYKGKECSLVIVHPYMTNTVLSVLNTMSNNPNVLNEVLKKLERKFVNLTLPKVDVKTTIDLKEVLKKMNVQRVFEEDAQLRRLLRNESLLFIDDARQQVHFEINEFGTHSKSSNGMDVQQEGAILSVQVQPPVEVNINSPFYFEVRCLDIPLVSGIIQEPQPVLKVKG